MSDYIVNETFEYYRRKQKNLKKYSSMVERRKQQMTQFITKNKK